MADKFRVGQKVRVNSNAIADVGLVFTIAELRKLVRVKDPLGSIGELFAYELSDGDYLEEQCLDPVYDGDEKSSWSECAWKPKQKVTNK
jgi:hypothetical protein